MDKEKDVKEQVLEDLMAFLEEESSQKLKPKKDTMEEMVPDAVIVSEEAIPEDLEFDEEDSEEDDLLRRIKDLIAKNGE